MRHTRCYLLALIPLLFVISPVQADVKPHGLFTDHMVLQQQAVLPVWGTADDGEEITVRCQEQTVQTQAKHGHWLVHLVNLQAGGPFELTIQGKNTVTLKDVLVGEVWVCSGQSNMEWPLRATANAEAALAGANYPQLRLFHVRNTASPQPLADVPGGPWVLCTPETVKNFTAVGYFFGRDLHQARKVPVGLIQTTWGGTPAEAWTPQHTLANHLLLLPLWERYERAVKAYPQRLALWEQQVKKLKEEQKPLPAKPADPGRHYQSPTVLYNGMIAPLLPFAIQGVIWYQGESNADRAYEYRTLFPVMIQSWRTAWKQGDFPFLCVQLAPFDRVQKLTWPELREAQALATHVLPHVGMVVITDVGHPTDIHPPKKEPVGARLALAARALAYREKIVHSGPIYDKVRFVNGKAYLRFTSIGSGLVARDGPLTGFIICGKDRKFVPAVAEIQGNEVVVWSKEVREPLAVRFGWSNHPMVNFFNQDGLPASPFRTDDFPGLTWPPEEDD